jgi:hypothetical protein
MKKLAHRTVKLWRIMQKSPTEEVSCQSVAMKETYQKYLTTLVVKCDRQIVPNRCIL